MSISRRPSTIRARIVVDPIGSSALWLLSDSGRIRRPYPAAKIIACIQASLLPGSSEAIPRLRLAESEVSHTLRGSQKDPRTPTKTAAKLSPDMASASVSRPPCTQDTRACDYWVWEHGGLRPQCCTEHLLELIGFTSDLLTRHG